MQAKQFPTAGLLQNLTSYKQVVSLPHLAVLLLYAALLCPSVVIRELCECRDVLLRHNADVVQQLAPGAAAAAAAAATHVTQTFSR
jgi:hypothetical protein